MNDQNETNPFIAATADTDDVCREDCAFDVDEEDALYDAYLMLRDAGYDKEELAPLAELLQRTTIYSRDDPEWFYQRFVATTEE